MDVTTNQRHKTEGGQGGKRGHSNMTHWERTEIIKKTTSRQRRMERRQIAHQAKSVRNECGQ